MQQQAKTHGSTKRHMCNFLTISYSTVVYILAFTQTTTSKITLFHLTFYFLLPNNHLQYPAASKTVTDW